MSTGKRAHRRAPRRTEALTAGAGALLAAGALAIGCATLATKGGEPAGLPHNGTGPFRDLSAQETGVTSPRGAALSIRGVTIDTAMVASDGSLFYASATALRPEPPDAGVEDASYAEDAGPAAADAGPSTPRFATPDWSRHEPRTIARSPARPAEGLQFVAESPGFDAGAEILRASEAWEGGFVTDPWAVIRADGSVLLYYVGEGGIGVATAASVAGPYAHSGAPLLAASGAGAPRRPSVIETTLLDGASHAFLMYYEEAGTIRVAGSSDGLAFEPLFALELPEMPARDDRDGDEVERGGPGAVVYSSAAGRSFVRLYYESRRSNGNTLLTLAASADGARFEAFLRPVVDARDRRAPCASLVDERVSLLYQWSPSGPGASQGTIFVGVAPGGLRLVRE